VKEEVVLYLLASDVVNVIFDDNVGAFDNIVVQNLLVEKELGVFQVLDDCSLECAKQNGKRNTN
jgi:hypothetical protein